MAITWSSAADKHGIPREEALYAMTRPHDVYDPYGQVRPGQSKAPTLFIGPSRFGTLEVLAMRTPPGGFFVFHVMLLRASTAASVGYEGEGA